MRQSAWFAWRFPPGLSRWRVILPDDAGSRSDAAEMRERGFALDPLWVVTGGDEQDRGGVDPDAVHIEKARRAATHERLDEPVESDAVGVEIEDASTERRNREFRRVQDRVATRRWAQRRGGARQVVSGHATQPFAQLIGCGEAEVTDLIQILDAHVTTGATRDEQRPDRLDITIRALRDPRCPTRQRRPPGFDRVDHIGLPLPASQLTVRTINLDHDHTLATQITRETRTVRAGAFHPHPRQFSKAGQPAIQLPETRPRRRERLHTQHAAGSINCRRDMHIQMGIDSARDRARALYDGHAIPSQSNGQGVARTSREGDRDEHAALTASSITLRNGACPIPPTQQHACNTERNGHHQHHGGPPN